MSAQQRKYFGTDGIRGAVGEGPINPEFVMKLGWAAGRVLARDSGTRQRVLIGKDTRVSGYMFESALEAGLSAAGADIMLLGPMPTPAVAYLTRTFHARAGIVISASHNAYKDNGIKFFSADGSKLPDETELEIEHELEQPMTVVASEKLGKVIRVEDAAGRYIEYCKRTIRGDIDFKGLKIVVDAANGATYHIAPDVFTELGATVVALGNSPDGFNINDGVGATSPAALQAAVIAEQADVGVALDGDGDRLIMVDKSGELVDGDELLYMIAKERQAAGKLSGGVVGTQMSNLGLEHAIKGLGLEFERANVGDRYILEMLNQRGWTLGGEASGHIICRDLTPSGDGIVSALQIVQNMILSNKSLKDLRGGMTRYPQTLINVRMKERRAVCQIESVQQAVQAVERELGDQGRVLLRPSGTEPLIRVMVEGRDRDQVDALAAQIAAAVEKALNQAETSAVV